jgi:hypothetical protein
MERLDLKRPRTTRMALLPLSPALPLGVHWHDKSWLCAEDEGCSFCELVPRRAVVYFAAACKTGVNEQSMLGLFERSASWYHEVCRLSGTNWSDSLLRLSIIDEIQDRSHVVASASLIDDQSHIDLVSVERLAFSVARLFRLPRFPSCESVGHAQRAFAAFAARTHELALGRAKEVHS